MCPLRTTKTVRGDVITLEDDKSYFIGNDTLIHLELKGFETKCRRKIYHTDFQNIFLLDVEKESPVKEGIHPSDVSVLKDFSIRSKFVFKKLKELLLSSLREGSKTTLLRHIS